MDIPKIERLYKELADVGCPREGIATLIAADMVTSELAKIRTDIKELRATIERKKF